MDSRQELIELRGSTGMNRREFSDYFGIPYRTVQEWELGNRRMPEYLFRLMEYRVRIENMKVSFNHTQVSSERKRYRATFLYSVILKDGEYIEYDHFSQDGKDMISVKCGDVWIDKEIAPFYCPDYERRSIYNLEAHKVYYETCVKQLMNN